MSNQAATTESSRLVVQRFYEYLIAGDFVSVLNCLHQDVEIHEPGCLPYGGVYRGHDGAKKLFSVAPTMLDIRVFDIEALVADGGRVVGFIRTAAAGSGESVLVAEESLVKDGKIVRVRVFQFDPMPVINAAKANLNQ